MTKFRDGSFYDKALEVANGDVWFLRGVHALAVERALKQIELLEGSVDLLNSSNANLRRELADATAKLKELEQLQQYKTRVADLELAVREATATLKASKEETVQVAKANDELSNKAHDLEIALKMAQQEMDEEYYDHSLALEKLKEANENVSKAQADYNALAQKHVQLVFTARESVEKLQPLLGEDAS